MERVELGDKEVSGNVSSIACSQRALLFCGGISEIRQVLSSQTQSSLKNNFSFFDN